MIGTQSGRGISTIGIDRELELLWGLMLNDSLGLLVVHGLLDSALLNWLNLLDILLMLTRSDSLLLWTGWSLYVMLIWMGELLLLRVLLLLLGWEWWIILVSARCHDSRLYHLVMIFRSEASSTQHVLHVC